LFGSFKSRGLLYFCEPFLTNMSVINQSGHPPVIKGLTIAGVLVSLGIVFGDIGTSPLYVMKAILAEGIRSSEGIIGAVSCVIWTLTLQTTIKYVLITLKADNKGEGGILALFALLRNKVNAIYVIAMIGAATLLADGVITPSITVLSAVEGLQIINPAISVIPITLVILSLLFAFQQFGTGFIGRSFGGVMFVWFGVIGTVGAWLIVGVPEVLLAFNPWYAINLLVANPGGIVVLGAVFLCTTGAEALYSDLGHCGIKNIRVSWIYVKTMLILNYLGQAAWIISQPTTGELGNPFFASMPQWLMLPGVILATMAAVIASQALISGSYTIISEAITLNFWPKVKVKYPTTIKGQMYIPSTNWLLFLACIFVVVFFGSSSNMEAAYGLSITLTMIMTSLLLFHYLKIKKRPGILIWLFIISYLTIEGVFLIANLHKFERGGWFTLLLAGIIFFVMFVWNNARGIKRTFTEYVDISDYKELLSDMSTDKSLPRFASNLVYVTRASKPHKLEKKIIYSIFNKQPKRADRYWLIRINITDEPYTKEYRVHYLVPGVLFRIDFFLGFKVPTRINRYFYQALSEMCDKKELSLLSNYESLHKHHVQGDFRFILIDRILTVDTILSPFNRFIMNAYDILKKFSMTSVISYGLDTSNVMTEQVPLGNALASDPEFHRIER